MPHIRPRAFPPPARPKGYRDTIDTTLGDSTDGPKGAAGTGAADGLRAIVALIPAESIAAYQSLYTLTGNGRTPLFGLVVWIILAATPLWQLYSTHTKGEPFAWDQAIISVPAFLVWLVALQSPFLNLPESWGPVESGVILLLGTFLLPLVAWLLNLAIGKISKRKT